MEKFDPVVIEFLDHSNRIESVFSEDALEDAIKAWEYTCSLDKLEPSDVVDIHQMLMGRIDPEIAGKYRSYAIRIGWEVKPFPGMEAFERKLKQICDVMNDKTVGGDLEKLTKEMHIEYEDLHCFGDGNGRSGRILYNWHRQRLGLPIHVIHEGDEQYEYYKWFEKDIPMGDFWEAISRPKKKKKS